MTLKQQLKNECTFGNEPQLSDEDLDAIVTVVKEWLEQKRREEDERTGNFKSAREQLTELLEELK